MDTCKPNCYFWIFQLQIQFKKDHEAQIGFTEDVMVFVITLGFSYEDN